MPSRPIPSHPITSHSIPFLSITSHPINQFYLIPSPPAPFPTQLTTETEPATVIGSPLRPPPSPPSSRSRHDRAVSGDILIAAPVISPGDLCQGVSDGLFNVYNFTCLSATPGAARGGLLRQSTSLPYQPGETTLCLSSFWLHPEHWMVKLKSRPPGAGEGW